MRRRRRRRLQATPSCERAKLCAASASRSHLDSALGADCSCAASGAQTPSEVTCCGAQAAEAQALAQATAWPPPPPLTNIPAPSFLLPAHSQLYRRAAAAAAFGAGEKRCRARKATGRCPLGRDDMRRQRREGAVWGRPACARTHSAPPSLETHTNRHTEHKLPVPRREREREREQPHPVGWPASAT